jgi:hypothetical protein
MLDYEIKPNNKIYIPEGKITVAGCDTPEKIAAVLDGIERDIIVPKRVKNKIQRANDDFVIAYWTQLKEKVVEYIKNNPEITKPELEDAIDEYFPALVADFLKAGILVWVRALYSVELINTLSFSAFVQFILDEDLDVLEI